MLRIVAGVALLAVALLGCGSQEKKAEETSQSLPKLTKLVVIDDVVGEGEEAADGDMVYMLYRGTLADGTEFDSNLGADQNPFNFPLGRGQVIKGWDQGIVGMRVGGKRTLKIPAELGYGAQDMGKIKPNSDLYFTIEMIGLVKPGDNNAFTRRDLKEGSGKAAEKGKKLKVHYRAKLLNGKVFDDSYERGEPIEFVLSEDEVAVPAWLAALPGLREGGIREITANPGVAYGMYAPAEIPPNSVVVFEVELIKVD